MPPEFSDEQINRIRSLLPAITDWSYFSNLANEHGVAALAGIILKNINFIQEY